MWQKSGLVDGLSWPSVSFAILVGSLLLSIYVLWRRFQSRRRLLQRVKDLESLSAAGRAIVASALDLTALCELIAQESANLLENSTIQLGLFDDTAYVIYFWTINGIRQETPRTFDISDQRGVVGWVRDSKRPLLVRDFNREMDSLPAKPRYVSDSPARSAIFIPMVSGETVIGILAAQHAQPNRFDEEDLRRLMILANQAAAAIAHAQLFEQAKRRADHLELVGQIARRVNAFQDQEEIFAHVVRLTQETFGFHPVIILTVEPESESLVVQASSAPELLAGSIRLDIGQGIVGTAVASRSVVVSNNTAESEHFLAQIPGRPETRTDTKAELAIPLIVNQEVLGALDVQSQHQGVFTPAEVTALEALAAEVASAIDKARQLAQQREQAWITTAQFQVAEAIDRHEDLPSIIANVTRLTAMLVGVESCGIMLWNEEMGFYQGVSLYGPEQNAVHAFERMRLAVDDWGPLDAVHVGQEALTTNRQPPWMTRSKASWATELPQITLLPISNRERVLGVMVISALDSDLELAGHQHLASGTQRWELLQNIIRQTAQAIESANLRMAQQEEAWVNTALLQVAESVNSLIDLNEILYTIVRLAPMLVGVKSALVLVWDEARQAYRAGPSHGISEMGRGLLLDHAIEEDEFPAAYAKPADLLTPNAIYYSMRLPPWLVKVLGTATAYAFPLYARGQMVGTFLVGAMPEDGYELSSRRLNILNGIAHQAATAVVNDQLYKESAERSRLEQELNVAREIQASLIPAGSPNFPGCSVSGYWAAARQVSGDFYDFLQLPDGTWSIAIADVADKGIPAALFMALCRTILRTVAFSRIDPASVLVRANQIINTDAQSDLFVTVFYAIWNPTKCTLSYANGGHNPPLLLNRNGESQLLTGNGIALGVLPDIEVESKVIHIQPGDLLLLYTDGVTEALNEDFDEFGLDRLLMTVRQSRELDSEGIIERITAAIGDHAGGTPQSDDITLVVMKRREV